MVAPIQINRELCLNNNYKKMQCDLCRKICPDGCINEDLAVDNKCCTECGLCLAVCPSEAVMGENFTPQALSKLFADPSTPVVLSCRRQDTESPWPCLGFIDARLLLALTACGTGGERCVYVDDRACEDCKKGIQAHLQKALSQANALLATYGMPPVQAGTAVAHVQPKAKPISRRAFFSELFGATVEAVRQAVIAGPACAERLPRQEMFNKYMTRQASDIPSQQVFHSLTVSDACRGCGSCAKFCPNKAITIQDQGGAAIDIYHDPMACTGCSVCIVHCPQQALSLTWATKLAKHKVAVTLLPRCTSCGQIYQPIGSQTMCLECMLKKRNQVLW
ncbi:4Fe-4S dicluster domain-containing protein [Sporolituus thermophilus]|uniref:4Fe-4S dicluster domain-containing protein n=1 Tax=Sporolituus thermophilus DSM 23256 TaxID=1123285 RepID=A0A1G7JIS1_9FIRM|nr:4Fe-4S binding protein [Sporolituus thermophilus]SDF24882.1 4Fe-4S dicluster domain-containing protein [Sporolituus thermophilus DSM 23256]